MSRQLDYSPMEIPREKYIPPEKRRQINDEHYHYNNNCIGRKWRTKKS